jgi:hypothetical protein
MKDEQTKAKQGEKMIEVRIKFWTNDIAEKGNIVPKHAWESGVVVMESNKSHGIKPVSPKPFHSLMDLPSTIEKVLMEQKIILHSSKRSKKYRE